MGELSVSEETNLLGRFGKNSFGLIGPCLRTGGNGRYEKKKTYESLKV